MRALTFHDKKDIRYDEQVAEPILKSSEEVIIEIAYVGICGSDLSRYKMLGPVNPGNVFGHEFSGVIKEVHKNEQLFKEGDRVAICPALPCNHCEHCTSGEYSLCPKMLVVGAKEPGAFAELIKVPRENIIPLPEEVSLKDAALIEPSSVVLHGLYKTNLSPGQTVAIYGCGAIGLLAVQWAKIFGATRVIAIDIDPYKLDIAKRIGADDVILPSQNQSSYKHLMEITNDEGVDLAIESAGSAITSEEIFAAPKRGGEIVFLGIPYSDIKLKRFYFERIIRYELTVHGAFNAISAPFPGKEFFSTIDFLKNGKLKMEPLISHVIPLEKGPEMFELVTNGDIPSCKVLFEL